MRWDQDAEKELEKAPEFVRDMARRKVEADVEKQGRNAVSLDDVREVFDEYMSYLEPDTKQSSTNIAIIRCERISETCPGTACLLALQRRRVRFKGYGDDAQLVAMITCGGCPGRRISRLLNTLAKTVKVDAVHLSSCMVKEEYQPPCPHREAILALIKKKGITVVEGTHH
jgi:predicted metal-binding protein